MVPSKLFFEFLVEYKSNLKCAKFHLIQTIFLDFREEGEWGTKYPPFTIKETSNTRGMFRVKGLASPKRNHRLPLDNEWYFSYLLKKVTMTSRVGSRKAYRPLNPYFHDKVCVIRIGTIL